MRVRILGEGQYLVPATIVERLNALDRELDAELAGEHPERFAEHLLAMHRLVRDHGTPAPLDDLAPSDALLPPEGSTLEELRQFLGEEGLVPG